MRVRPGRGWRDRAGPAFVQAEAMIQNLIADNLHIARQLRAAMELADEQRDHPTSNLLQEILDDTEKRRRRRISPTTPPERGGPRRRRCCWRAMRAAGCCPAFP
ncbi:MAG: ferritin-like domain-containing protein [Roseiflexaceae bacterium]